MKLILTLLAMLICVSACETKEPQLFTEVQIILVPVGEELQKLENEFQDILLANAIRPTDKKAIEQLRQALERAEMELREIKSKNQKGKRK